MTIDERAEGLRFLRNVLAGHPGALFSVGKRTTNEDG